MTDELTVELYRHIEVEINDDLGLTDELETEVSGAFCWPTEVTVRATSPDLTIVEVGPDASLSPVLTVRVTGPDLEVVVVEC